MKRLYLVEYGGSISMETADQIDDTLSKNEPMYIEIYQSDNKGTFIKHEVNTRQELDTLLTVWEYYNETK